MRAAWLACVLVACVPPATDPQPGYYPQPTYQQPYPQQQYAQPQQPQYAQPQPQQPYAPPQPQVAATGLTCGQVLTECYRGGTDPNRCAQERGTPRAQWLIMAIAKCATVQMCKVGSCVEQGCPQPLALCRADRSTPSDPVAQVAFEGVEWYTGGVSLMGFYSPTTGFDPGMSSGSSWKFENGTFQKGAMLSTRMYTCGMNTFIWTTGRYKLEGDTLTVVEEHSKVKVDDSCSNKHEQYEGKHDTQVFRVAVEPDDFFAKPELVFYENGKEYARYSPRN